MAKTLKLKTGYENTEDTRNYILEVEDSLAADVKGKILAINASLASGTSDGMNTFFISDNGDNLKAIVEARLITTTEIPVAIGG